MNAGAPSLLRHTTCLLTLPDVQNFLRLNVPFYRRLHLATKGPTATCRWLQSVLISPEHLNVPTAQSAHNSDVKGARVGAIHPALANDGVHFAAAGSGAYASAAAATTTPHGDEVGADRRREIEKAKQRRQFLAEERRRKRPKQLNGFMLLDACGCELPNEGRRADVSSRGLVEVVREDLTYFSRLQVVDAGDNSLPFESFSGLPRIEELFVPCNNIREIGSMRGRKGYGELRRLDLSYNNLSAHALSALALLPSLLDLDLTCNGLTELPSDMGNLPRLQKLSLERNQLESDGVIDVSRCFDYCR